MNTNGNGADKQVLTPERRAKIQEMADVEGISFIFLPDGSVQHHPPDAEVPLGAEVIRPRKEWVVSPHGAPEGGSDVPTSS
jgi:hypothetical protein